MKRSEALILIANQLDFLNSKFEGYKTNFTKQELSNADVILTTLEQAGMSPPDDLGVVFGHNEGYITPPTWEPEDEEE